MNNEVWVVMKNKQNTFWQIDELCSGVLHVRAKKNLGCAHDGKSSLDDIFLQLFVLDTPDVV